MIRKQMMGKTGLEVSLLGLGCMRFPQDENGVIDQQQVNKMIDYAYASGINYYDTAPVYGDGKSETALGNAISRYPRESYYLATKCPIWEIKEVEDVETILNDCLNRLHTNYVDFFLLHAINADRVKIIKEKKIIDKCLELKQRGIIKHLGFSIHAPYAVLLDLLDLYPFEFGQVQLNYLDEETDPGLKGYEELRKRGIPVVVMEPVKGGIIANLTSEIGKPLRDFSNDSFASFGYRWVMDHDAVRVVLSGSSSFDQIKDNIKTFSEDKRLSKEEYDAISKVKANLEARQKVGCTGCGYCMPCPFGVRIPRSFWIWNYIATYNDMASFFDKEPYPIEDLKKCKECHACETKCPQGIKIPAKLKQMLEEATK